MLMIVFRPQGERDDSKDFFFAIDPNDNLKRPGHRRWVRSVSLAEIFEDPHTACSHYTRLCKEASGDAADDSKSLPLPASRGSLMVIPLRKGQPLSGCVI